MGAPELNLQLEQHNVVQEVASVASNAKSNPADDEAPPAITSTEPYKAPQEAPVGIAEDGYPKSDAPAAVVVAEPAAEVEVEVEKEQELAPEIDEHKLREGLRKIGRTACGLEYAYKHLVCNHKAVTSLEALLQFSHLTRLDISNNSVKSLAPVSALQHLTSLHAAHNLLEDGGLSMEKPPPHLVELNLSHNRIRNLAPLAVHTYLRRLTLDSNHIHRLGEISSLTCLEELKARHNQVDFLAGIGSLPLSVLDISFNKLHSVAELASVVSLKELHVASNVLTSVRGIGSLWQLNVLDVSNNNLATLEELRAAQGLTLLRRVATQGNGFHKARHARLHILHLLPFLINLDGVYVDAKEKVHAANLHGADAAAVASIRRKYFPEGEVPEAQVSVARQISVDGIGRASSSPGTRMIVPRGENEFGLRSSLIGKYVLVDSKVREGTSSLTEDGIKALAKQFVDGTEELQTQKEDSTGAQVETLTDPSKEREGVLETVRACFTWVVSHTSYESLSLEVSQPVLNEVEAELETIVAATLSNMDVSSRTSLHVENCTDGWSNKTAVLLKLLIEACGFECSLVRGYSKGPNFAPGSVLPRTNHTWNAVKIVDKWELIDCAWACAYNAYDNSYFLAAPDEFIYENFPESEEWQLLDEPICISQFWDMPQCTAAFFKSNLRLNGSAASALYPLAGSTMMTVTAASSPDTVLLLALSRDADATQVLHRRTFAQREGMFHVMYFAFPESGEYFSRVLAKDVSDAKRALRHGHELMKHEQDEVQPYSAVLRYKFVVELDDETPVNFPGQGVAFQALGCRLFRPMDGVLVSNTAVQFRLLVPGARLVALVASLDEEECDWQLLKCVGHSIYDSFVTIPASSNCQVIAQYPDDLRPVTLLTYTAH